MAGVLSLGNCHFEGSMIRYIMILFDCTANKVKNFVSLFHCLEEHNLSSLIDINLINTAIDR